MRSGDREDSGLVGEDKPCEGEVDESKRSTRVMVADSEFDGGEYMVGSTTTW